MVREKPYKRLSGPFRIDGPRHLLGCRETRERGKVNGSHTHGRQNAKKTHFFFPSFTILSSEVMTYLPRQELSYHAVDVSSAAKICIGARQFGLMYLDASRALGEGISTCY